MTVEIANAVLVNVLAIALTTDLNLRLRSRTDRAGVVARPANPGACEPKDHYAVAPTTGATADLAPVEPLGARATLVQFSTLTCARYPATRRQLDAVAVGHHGITRLEIRVAECSELARRFAVMQTPTMRAVRIHLGGPSGSPKLAATLDTVGAGTITRLDAAVQEPHVRLPRPGQQDTDDQPPDRGARRDGRQRWERPLGLHH